MESEMLPLKIFPLSLFFLPILLINSPSMAIAICRDITMDDCKDLLDMKGTTFDVLAAVGERAKQIFEDHAAAARTSTATLQEKIGDLTMDDCKDVLDLKGTAFDVLAAERGKQIFEHHAAPARTSTATLPEKFRKVIERMAHEKTLTAPATIVIQKKLFDSDLSHNNNRLSIPMRQIVRDDFLTDDEKRYLQTYYTYKKKINEKYVEVKKKNFMHDVKIIEPSLELETVKFCRWDMPKPNGGRMSSSYIINGKNWSSIVRRNSLRKDMEVQLWCFRVDQELCFALVPLPHNHDD